MNTATQRAEFAELTPTVNMGMFHTPGMDAVNSTSGTTSIQQPAPMTSSSFEKLPTELHLQIVRLAMPQSGLRLRRRDKRYFTIAPGAPVTQRQWHSRLRTEDSVPTGLFLTNKYISTLAQDIFHNEVEMHISVSPENLTVFDKWVPSFSLPASMPANKVQHFTSMRCYCLNIRLRDERYIGRPWGLTHQVILTNYRKSVYKLKEQLRFVCDMLAHNSSIQRMTITFPCHCILAGINNAPPALKITQDYLAPLRRLRVAKPVTFVPAHGKDPQNETDLCNKPACLQLAHQIQLSIGRLEGEALSHREETWKKLKKMKRPHGQWSQTMQRYDSLLKSFWGQLEEEDYEDFDSVAKRTMIAMEHEYNTWEMEKAMKESEKEG
ncbi:MAG: hypothetical protein Q9166_006185 [cf. Caloplaca sp. 2 TL-2023]